MVDFLFQSVGRVIVDSAACESLRSFRQADSEFEKAGVLAGFRSSCGAWNISRVMPPSSKSRASKYWVYRDLPTAQHFINEEFSRSEGFVNYLGEWHTHPCVNPTPSRYDKKMIADLLRNSSIEIDFLVGIIVGTNGSACCWVQRLIEKGQIVNCPPQNFTVL